MFKYYIYDKLYVLKKFDINIFVDIINKLTSPEQISKIDSVGILVDMMILYNLIFDVMILYNMM